MNKTYRSFSALHPGVSFFYFACVFLSFFLTQNPVPLCLAFFSGLFYQLVLEGGRRALKSIALASPLAFFILLLNPLLNHNGETPLFYLNSRPFTLESLLYGGVMALVVMNTLLWFAIANDSIDHDKIIFLFGRPFPTAALMLGMIFRVTGNLKKELEKVRYAQKSLGLRTDSGTFASRLKSGREIFICVLGNALEHSVDTAAAMKSRGYGLPGHSRRRQYRFHKRDVFCGSFILISFIAICYFCLNAGDYTVFPKAQPVPFHNLSILYYILYAFFLNLPLIFEGEEALKWRYFNWKI